MKKILLVLATVVLLVLGMAGCMQIDRSSFNLSTEPHIVNLPKQKMIIAEATGTPEEIAGKCIGELYKVYFALNFKEKKMEPPFSRWTMDPKAPASMMTAAFALPVPEEVTSLPELKGKKAVEVKLGYWEYGDTAEFLYKGPYDGMKEQCDKLQAYAESQGFVFSGPHEEIYIKGPGMFGKGDPKKYETIIRYQLKKAEIKKGLKKKK